MKLVYLRSALLLSFMLGCALQGCGSGSTDTTTPANDPNSIVGTWTVRSLTDGTTTQTCPAAFVTYTTTVGQYGVQCSANDTIVFTANGTCRVSGDSTLYNYMVTSPNTVTIIVPAVSGPGGTSNVAAYLATGTLDLSSNTLALNFVPAANVTTFAVHAVQSNGNPVNAIYQRHLSAK